MGCLNEETSSSGSPAGSRREDAFQRNQSTVGYSQLQRSSVIFILVSLLAAIAIPQVELTTDIAGKSIETIEKLLLGAEYNGLYAPTTRFYDFHVSSFSTSFLECPAIVVSFSILENLLRV